MKWNKMATAVHNALFRYQVRMGMILPALALEIDKDAHGALPESTRGLYVEKDGKFRLDVSGIPVPEDTSGLKTALEKERQAVKEAKAAHKRDTEALAAKYKDVDPDKYREIMAQFNDAEEAELMKKGADGIRQIIERRTEKLREEMQRKLQEVEEREGGALEVASTFMDRVLDNHIRAAAMAAGVHPAAVEDALLRASLIFQLDDDGNPVQYEGDDQENPTIVLGKDGKTPFSPTEWFEEMKEKAPHWFPAQASGSGAAGSRANVSAGGKTMKRAAWEGLSPQEKMDFSRTKGVVVD